MSQMEVLMWLSVIKTAKEGNSEAMNHLQAENKIRQEQNRPTVEQELKMIAQQQEDEIPMSEEEILMMQQMENWQRK